MVSKEVSKYMAMIGRRGGKKSKGKLSSEQAKRMARMKKEKRQTLDRQRKVR